MKLGVTIFCIDSGKCIYLGSGGKKKKKKGDEEDDQVVGDLLNDWGGGAG